MDQVLTGKFIAEERKQKGFTQKQLAEKLNISDKTVSKWETGNGFPEISLLLPLCEELEITVNELLAGERVPKEDYQMKAEENMVKMITEEEANKEKRKLVIVLGIISLISFLMLLVVVIIYTDVIALPIKVLVIVISCAVFATGFMFVYEGGRTIGYYKCPKCGEKFVPKLTSYMFGTNLITKRHLKCPKCANKSWCKKVMSKDD